MSMDTEPQEYECLRCGKLFTDRRLRRYHEDECKGPQDDAIFLRGTEED